MSAPDPRSVPAAHSMDTAWFGVDEEGNVGLFGTGEAGAMPVDAAGAGDHARPLGGHPDGFAAIGAALGIDEEALYDDRAPAPVYRFEHDDDNAIAGRYVRSHAPFAPARIEQVPEALRPGIIPLPVRFAAAPPIQPVEHVPCEAWGPTWLSSDGTTARAFPGREAEAEEDWEGNDMPDVTFVREAGAPRPAAAPRIPSSATSPPRAFFPSPIPGAADVPPAGSAPPEKPWWKFW